MYIVLISDPKSHNHPYIYNNTICVYLTNQMFEESLILLFFLIINLLTKYYYNMITMHIHVTNSLYFLIIKLYKVILYLYYTGVRSLK